MSNSNLFLFCWTRTRRSFCTTITKNPPPPLDFTKTPISRLPTVIILGRPNVGKSAIFNRLIRRREALVYNTPDDHVTRDIREGIAKLGHLRFRVLDSAGLEAEATSGSILHRTASFTANVLATSKLWRTIPSYATHSFSTLSIAPIAPKLHESQHFMKWGFRMMSRFATGFNPLREKPLDSIVDIHRLKDRYPDDIASIWDDYHIGRGHIGGTMKSKLYHLLDHRAKECRYFVIPLWRGNGYTTMFLQVQTPYMVFTGLEDYKARGTQASPYFSVCFYTEFAETKDLVLIRGDIVFTSKLTDSEAKWLMETAQSFYLNDVRYKLVERFNKDPRDFDFKDVLQALDMPIL